MWAGCFLKYLGEERYGLAPAGFKSSEHAPPQKNILSEHLANGNGSDNYWLPNHILNIST